MPGMRPLLLPQLVAAGSSTVSLDKTRAKKSPPGSLRSQRSSPDGSADLTSSPMTLSFSSSGPGLSHGSTSSLNSASSSYEFPSFMVESKKLSGVAEEPSERREAADLSRTGIPSYTSGVGIPVHETIIQYGDCDPLSLTDDWTDISANECIDMDLRSNVKKRRSADTSLNSVVMRVGNHLPSLSTRWKDRKSIIFAPRQPALSSNSSRSSSMTGSVLASVERRDGSISSPPPSNDAVVECGEEEAEEMTPTNNAIAEIGEDGTGEPVDRKALASTPLLPPVLAPIRTKVDTPVQSPLQSPSVADASTPFAINRFSGVHSPALSTRPSVSSLQRGAGHNHLKTSIDLPPMMGMPPYDEWAVRLGHANFTIFPEPYSPERCTARTCQQLFADWESARRNYNIHQVRTGEHFGVTSKTYRLTEEKWAEVEAQWKRRYDAALAQIAEASTERVTPAPVEPAPLVKVPSLRNPKGVEKFPELGDEDIVGPMVQLSVQPPRRTLKMSSCFKIFKGLKMGSPFSRRPTSKF